MNELIIGALLGIVEGITEFLPISSTGHLIVVGDALHFTGPRAETFEVFIQLGAILAVVVLYWRRFLQLFSGILQPKVYFSELFTPGLISAPGLTGARGMVKVGVACAPAFILGAIAHKAIKAYLFSSFTVAIAMIVGGVLLIAIEQKRPTERVRSLNDLTVKDAFMVGVFQCLALWPGMSRSASTIIGGLLSGVSRSIAAEFSFLVAVPVMIAATGLDLVKSLDLLSLDDVPLFAVGFMVSFIVALIAIKAFLALLQKITFTVFGLYRIVFGIAVLLFVL